MESNFYTKWPMNQHEAVVRMNDLMSRVQVWFCDLDDTHAPSPAKEIARNALGAQGLFDKRFIQWAKDSAKAYLFEGKKAESRQWRRYIDAFLDEEGRGDVAQRFTEDVAQKRLYAGVQLMYRKLSGEKHYVSRNIKEAVGPFRRVMDFDGQFCEAEDKALIVMKYAHAHPEITHYGVDGDSVEDQEMVTALKSLGKKVFAIQTLDRRSQEMDGFDLYTTRDRSTLAHALVLP